MIRYLCALAALLFCVMPASADTGEEDKHVYKVFQPDIPPWGDGDTDSGFIVEIVHKAFTRAGIAHEFVYAPWKREQAAVQQNGRAFMAPLTRLEAREPHYRWVAPVNISFLQLVTRDRSLVSLPLDALTKLPIAARMESPAQFSAQSLGFNDITLVEDEMVGARLMMANRVTLWMQRGLPGLWAYEQSGGNADELIVLKSWPTPQQYLVASLDVPLAVTEKLAAILTEMRLSGEIDQIKQSYFKAPLRCDLLFTCTKPVVQPEKPTQP